MSRELWALPPDVTTVMRGPHFRELSRQRCELLFSLESTDGSEQWHALVFGGVEVFKCTHSKSIGTIPHDVRREAYGKVIIVSNSVWRDQVNTSYSEHMRGYNESPRNLHHMAIYFDDGPCFEFICSEFKVVDPSADNVEAFLRLIDI